MPARPERLDEALAWLRHVESMHEDVARRELRDRMRRDARAARTELRLPRPWPSMPDGARRMFDSDGEIVRLRRIVDLVGADARILDVGCGPGVVGGALALHDRPGAYLGIDLSEPKIASAREMAATNRLGDRLRFDVGDAAELPEHTIAELAPDTVLILEVLEHLEEPADVLASIAQLVSDDARIIFSVPILGRIEACWGHRTLFGAGAIVGLADACDLHLLDVEEIHNTWALATVGRQPTRHVPPAGTSPIAIRHVSPSAVRADVASATRHRQPPRLVLPIGPGESAHLETETPGADWIRVDLEVDPPTALAGMEVVLLDESGAALRSSSPDIGRLPESGRRTFFARPQEADLTGESAVVARTRVVLTAAPTTGGAVTLWRLGFASGYRGLLPRTDASPSDPVADTASTRRDAPRTDTSSSGRRSPFDRVTVAAADAARTLVRRWPRLRPPANAARKRYLALRRRWRR